MAELEMYQYRQVIHRIRMGQSDWTIAKSGLMERIKCDHFRTVAKQHGWPGATLLFSGDPPPADSVLSVQEAPHPTRQTLALVHEAKHPKMASKRIRATIHHVT